MSVDLFILIFTDHTTRIYDIRYPTDAFAVIKGQLGAIRSLDFSDDGSYLVMAEPADFVHIVDMSAYTEYPFKNLEKPEFLGIQTFDFFGEISGVGFSPDHAGSLFIANAGMSLSFE
jgi:WD40 repeat protein